MISLPVRRFLSVLCAGISLASLSRTPLASGADDAQLRVTALVANVRSGPSVESPVQFQVQRGDLLRLLDVSGDWFSVEIAGGRRGYLFRTLAERVIAAPETPASTPLPPSPPPAASNAATVAIDHSQIGCVVAEQHPQLDACFRPDSNVGRAQVHFRAAESDPWFAVQLKADGACYRALLPKPSREIKQFQYYVDVVDRGFAEVSQPAAGPGGAYRVKVVAREGDCDKLARIAAGVLKATDQIVVSIVRDAAGRSLDAGAASMLEGRMLLTGFRPEGVVVSSTGAAPAGSAGAASSTGGHAAAAAGGGAGKGLLIAGGVVAAGAAVAVAVKGGGDSGGGGTGGSPGTVPATTGTQPGTGDIAFRLTWSTGADLDIYVQEPNGNVIYYANASSTTGGRLDVDSNAACSNLRASPVENVFWPTGSAPRGTYRYWVQHFGCGPASSFTLQVLRGVGGSVVASNSGDVSPSQQSTHFSFVF